MNLFKNLRQAKKNIELNLFQEAQQIYQKILEKYPNNLEAINNSATIYLIHNDMKEANKLYEKSLIINNQQIEILLNLSNYYLNNLDHASATKFVTDAYKIQPTHWQTSFNLGRLKYQENAYLEALKYYQKALNLNPNFSLIYNNIGLCYEMLGSYEDALKNYQHALTLSPGEIKAHINIASLHLRFHKYTDCLTSIELAMKYVKNNLEIECIYIDCLILMRNLTEAEEAIQRNYLIHPEQILIMLREIELNYIQEDYSKAEEIAKKVLNKEKNNAEALSNLLLIYANTNNLEKFDELIKNFPFIIEGDYQKNKLLIALNKLKNFDFKTGWEFYKSRFFASGVVSNRKYFNNISKFNIPESINNVTKKTLIIKEQGLGDQILFTKFLTLIENKNIDVQIDKRLLELYKRNLPQICFVDEVRNEDYEYMIGLADIGSYFLQDKNDFKNFNDFKMTKLVDYQIPIPTKKRCGISWKSHAQTGDAKTISLENFKKIISTPDLTFINLQYGDVDAEIEELNNSINNKLENDRQVDKFNDMEKLFALVNSCDYIITTSNVTAHIAGILGKKTFLLIVSGRGKLWYWNHIENGYSLWYPSIKIYEFNKTLSNFDKVTESILREIKL